MKLKVISWNIWRGKNLEEVIKFLKHQDADVIGLQEVIETEDGENQAKFIAEALNYHFIYCKAFTTDRHETAYGIGNAILSKYPFEESECLMLSDLEDYQGTSTTEPRGAARVKINLEGEAFSFFCTHLSFNEDSLNSSPLQLKQLDELLKFLPKEKTLLMGDFNSQPKCEVVKRLSRELVNTDPNPTEPSWEYVEGPGKYSNLRIDYIFTTPDVNFANFQVLESEASDHKPLVVSIQSENLKEKYREKILSLRGQGAGQKWLDSIPELISKSEKKWGIKVGEPFKLFLNYVAPATKKDGTEVVIKFCFADDEEFLTEADALKLFKGQGMVRLLDVDFENGVLLLEKVSPGEPLTRMEDDEKATGIMAEVMRKIWIPAPKEHRFPTLKDWSKDFTWYHQNYQDGMLTEDLVKKAEQIFKEFLENSNGEYLLHGDLWQENILSSERDGWLAIDPKGVVGEREYEVAAMLRNPNKKLVKMSEEQLRNLFNKRLDILSEKLGFDRNRLLKWGFAQTVLSVIWNMQGDKERWHDWVRVAKVLDSLL